MSQVCVITNLKDQQMTQEISYEKQKTAESL